jgi:hypothetical protein
MASVKEYAYYLEGNRVAIVERDTAFDNDPNSKDYGPGSDRSAWKSPKSSVLGGLEINYTHALDYYMPAARNIGWEFNLNTGETVTSIYTPCYGENEGYLAFYFPGKALADGPIDTTFLDPSSADSQANYKPDGERWIVVHNHPRWNGVHKIKSAALDTAVGFEYGLITTYTKWSSGLAQAEADDTLSDVLFGWGAGNINLVDVGTSDIQTTVTAWNKGFSVGDYAFVATKTSSVYNGGLFKISALSDDGNTITVDTAYYSDTTTSGKLASIEVTLSSLPLVAELYSANNMCINQALLCEGAYIDVWGVQVLEDESFELDLPPFLQQALVYYVKMRAFEDLGDIDRREYFDKLFRKHLERYENSRISGLRIISPGPNAIR